MVDLILFSFLSTIYCCMLLSCVLLNWYLLEVMIQNWKEEADLKLYQGGKLLLLQNMFETMMKNVLLKIGPCLQMALPFLQHHVLQVNI